MFEQIFCDDVMLVYTVVVVLNIAKDAFRRQNVAGLVQLIRTLRGRHAIENIDVKSISFIFPQRPGTGSVYLVYCKRN